MVSVSLIYIELYSHTAGNVRIDVTVRRVLAATVAVEKQQLKHIVSVCL
jgi:hypothetical protein